MKVLVVTAIYPTADRPAFGSFVHTQVASLRRVGVDVDVLVLEGRRRKLIYPRGVVQLRRRIARERFDLIHAHYSFVGMVARMQRRLPVVVTYHGDDVLGTVDELGRQVWFTAPVVVAGRLLAGVVDASIVQTAEMAERLGRPNVHVIPHEVDFDVFRPTVRDEARGLLGLERERRYVLFASPPDIPVKRYPLAQEAVARLRADCDVELVVVHTETQDRLALYMSACDALVFPSFQEGSPNIVKQAMACNLPIVASDVGDVRTLIDGTPWCFVCEPDAAVLAARLAEIVAVRPRTDGRERVRHLDCETVARRVVGVYEHVLERARARPPGRPARVTEG